MRFRQWKFFCALSLMILASAPSLARSQGQATDTMLPGLLLQEIRVLNGPEVESVVHRLIEIEAGATIDLESLLHSREQLMASGAFKDVQLFTARGDKPGAVILMVEAELDRGFHFETGLGRELMKGWYLNLIGFRYASPFDRGGYIRVVAREFRLTHGLYSESVYPGFLDRDLDLLLEMDQYSEFWPISDGDRMLVQKIRRSRVQLGLRRWCRDGAGTALFFNYHSAKPDNSIKNAEGDFVESAGVLVPLSHGTQHFLDVHLDLSWDGRDITRAWQRGRWTGLRFTFTNTIGGRSFFSGELDTHLAVPVNRHSAMAFRLHSGYTGEGTPYHLRPIVGGVGSLRGFGQSSLGGPTGARFHWQTSAEYRLALLGSDWKKPRVMQTLFADFGDVWSDEWDYPGLAANVGYGLLIRVPWLRMINVEIAYPLTDNFTDDAVLAMISLGRSF